MFWNDRLKVAATGAAFTLAFIAGAAGAAPLVVKSSGPSAAAYPAGKAIANSARIALKAGDTVVILDGRGTRTLRGPGLFSPTEASNQLADSRDTIDLAQKSQRTRIGAVRGFGGADTPRNPNIWFVDIARSSNVCVTDPSHVTLWRGHTADPAVVTVTGSGGRSEQMAWAKGQELKEWPTDLPIANGAQYSLTWPGAAAPTTLRFSVLGAGTSGIEDTAALLIKSGCQAQLDLLIETVSIPASSGTPAG